MEEKNDQIIEQFVQNVEDFSSQYGSEISVSYSALNLRGPPSTFPDYGDYPQAFVMRTYGPWWEEAPSYPEEFTPQVDGKIQSQDFVEVSYEKAVYPQEVFVFETFNPGALVRIWALGPTSWALLWEGEPENVKREPRVFSPPLKQVNFPTRILRLEFNHKLLPYYTELDAILLKGKEPTGLLNYLKPKIENPNQLYIETPPLIEKGFIMKQIIASNLCKFTEASTSKKPVDANVVEGPQLKDHFHRLPDETIVSVFKHLDMTTLCRCARVNKQFRRLASDPMLYKCVDLRPYWHCVRSEVLMALSTKCKYLQKLDLSWCGSHFMIESYYVELFLEKCGANLRKLRMNCCKFVNDSVLKAVVRYAPNLEELCLRSVTDCTGWSVLEGLTKLERLDLYRTNIPTKAATAIVMSNPGLQHINLGSCKMISAMDEVAHALGLNCPNLRTVDFWKSFSLTANGIKSLGKCKNLEELDLGWCRIFVGQRVGATKGSTLRDKPTLPDIKLQRSSLQAGASGEWLASLAGGQLRKLFLGALRGVCDRDLRLLLPRATKLAQLDLLGVRAVSPDVCADILAECRELKLLDVSFCDQIEEYQVLEWRKQYPKVSIKRSFQSGSLRNTPSALFLAPSLE